MTRRRKQPGIIVPPSFERPQPRLRKISRAAAWILSVTLALGGSILVIQHFTAPTTYKQSFSFEINDAPRIPLLTMEIVQPRHLTVGKWDILTATVTSVYARPLTVKVPMESNATLKPLQEDNHCFIGSHSGCELQWAIQATAPGTILVRSRPTFEQPNAAHDSMILDLPLAPMFADDKPIDTANWTLTTLWQALIGIAALAAIVQAAIVLADHVTRTRGATLS